MPPHNQTHSYKIRLKKSATAIKKRKPDPPSQEHQDLSQKARFVILIELSLQLQV